MKNPLEPQLWRYILPYAFLRFRVIAVVWETAPTRDFALAAKVILYTFISFPGVIAPDLA
jgi:hypothetical protein